MQQVIALFIDPTGPYPKLLGKENCWDVERDARLYPGPHPVVAHPICNLWVNLAACNYARSLKEPNRRKVIPAWYPGGTDGGCFYSALLNVCQYGGVLEHPAYSHAWEHYGLVPPLLTGWSRDQYWDVKGHGIFTYWCAEVWQSAYDHACQKRTWLFYCGNRPPFELDWSHKPGTHQIGWFDRKKKTLNKREASLTPTRFAETLVALARHSRGS